MSSLLHWRVCSGRVGGMNESKWILCFDFEKKKKSAKINLIGNHIRINVYRSVHIWSGFIYVRCDMHVWCGACVRLMLLWIERSSSKQYDWNVYRWNNNQTNVECNNRCYANEMPTGVSE